MKLGDSVATPPTPCPRCGAEIIGAAVVGKTGPVMPKPGSVTVCFSCAAPLKFLPGLALAELTDAEIATFDEKTLKTVSAVERAIRLFNERRRRR
jgi:hypothetical protein